MNAFAALLRAILRFAVVGTLVVIGIIGFFMAWWLVLFALMALALYIGIRRMFGVTGEKPHAASGGVVIEGDYEVERDGPGGVERASGRVIEVREVPRGHGIDDNNPKL
ncbi:MAG: hypothetical protein FJY55_02950 [Betaproteobacteria bacterium]|nr:hypothetical protein [Betaproteobacteria bacterium]